MFRMMQNWDGNVLSTGLILSATGLYFLVVLIKISYMSESELSTKVEESFKTVNEVLYWEKLMLRLLLGVFCC